MCKPLTNRNALFGRELVETFQLKGNEAKPEIKPGIQPVWLARPKGVTYLERSCVYPVTHKVVPVSDIAADATRSGPTAWSSFKVITAVSTKSLFDNIPAGFCFQLRTNIVAALVPTAEISIQIKIVTTVTVSEKYRFDTRIGIANFQPINWTSPVFYSDVAMSIDFTVGAISPVGQVLSNMAELFVYPVGQNQS